MCHFSFFYQKNCPKIGKRNYCIAVCKWGILDTLSELNLSLFIYPMKKIHMLSILLILSNESRAQISQPGELDTTFNFGFSHSILSNLNQYPAGAGFNSGSYVNLVVARPNGKILVGGDFGSYNGISKCCLIQLHENGTPDTAFNARNNLSGNDFNDLILQPDGKVLLTGTITQVNGLPGKGIVRLNDDGSLDTTFQPAIHSNTVNSAVLQSNGKIVLSQTIMVAQTLAKSRVFRLLQNGQYDSTFSTFADTIGLVHDMAIQANGKIILIGNFPSFGLHNNGAIRLNPNGTLDSTFQVGQGANDRIWASCIQADQKILLGGWFSQYNGLQANTLVRLKEDGSVDSTFSIFSNISSLSFPGVYGIASLNDGRVYITGNNPSSLTGAGLSVILLQSNGQIDTTFNAIISSIGVGVNVALQTDNKVIVVGSFSRYGNVWRQGIARIWGVSPTVGFADESISNVGVSIYPNPAWGAVYLQNARPGKYEIHDLQGKIIQTGILTSEAQQMIDLSRMSKGLYILRLIDARQSSTHKLLVK